MPTEFKESYMQASKYLQIFAVFFRACTTKGYKEMALALYNLSTVFRVWGSE